MSELSLKSSATYHLLRYSFDNPARTARISRLITAAVVTGMLDRPL